MNQIVNSILDGEAMRRRFDDLLGKQAPQFISSLVSLVNATPQLQQAMYEAPMTVIQSALKVATYDLPIDASLGYAYIVQVSSTLGGLWQLLMGTAMVPVDAVWPTILTYSLAGGALGGALGSMFSIRKHLNV